MEPLVLSRRSISMLATRLAGPERKIPLAGGFFGRDDQSPARFDGRKLVRVAPALKGRQRANIQHNNADRPVRRDGYLVPKGGRTRLDRRSGNWRRGPLSFKLVAPQSLSRRAGAVGG